MKFLLAALGGLAAASLSAAPLNPVREGLPPFGLRDPQITRTADAWWLVATDVPPPGAAPRGLVLHRSADLTQWTEAAVLIDAASAPAAAWWRDGWGAPELFAAHGRHWLVWHGRNDAATPYGPMSIGLAVADQLTGPYRVLTTEAPLTRGANPTLWTDPAGEVHLLFDRDGRLFAAPIDLAAARLTAAPRALLPEPNAQGAHRLHIAPALVTHGDRLHLFYSTFAGGYRIHHASATDLAGPWQADAAPVFSWDEDDADTVLKNAYPPDHTFAPPTEITGQVSIFPGPDQQPWFAYHSPDKYSEPFLCIDPLAFTPEGGIAFAGRTLGGRPVDPTPRLTYAAHIPKEIPLSPHYAVEVITGASTLAPNVYHADATWRTNNSRDTAWASFPLAGSVTVRVTRRGFAPIDYCAVLPASRGIVPRIIAPDTVEFTLDRPGQVSVEFERGQKIAHPLLVFADPPEHYDFPVEGPDVIRFEAGLHELTVPLNLRAGQTVYLAPGAWVRGQIHADSGDNIRVVGRGILDGIRYPARGAEHMITTRNAVAGALVEGITMVNAPRFNIVLGGPRSTVRNVKMIGWWFSTDGVSTGEDGLIEDCFFKVNDDAIKLYRSGTTARRCVIWQMENGAPFMLSWNMSTDNARFHAHDIDIIRVEHEWDNPNLAVITAIHGSAGVMSDYLFERIRVDHASWRPFHFMTRPNHFGAWHPDRGALARITVRDFTFNGRPRIPSLIRGWDEHHPVSDIRFENVVIDGRRLTDFPPDLFQIDPATTRNLQVR